MSIWVKVTVNFYTNRKTAKLRTVLGNDAFWIPPRLWAYAAENQPDGVFENYSHQEIANLIGYTKDAKRMLQALLQAGFLDEKPLRIHDWHDHNGYHTVFAERAKRAAEARWQKERSKEKEIRGGEKSEALLQASAPSPSGDAKPAGARTNPPTSEMWRLQKDRKGLIQQIRELKEASSPDHELLAGLQAELKRVNEAIRAFGRGKVSESPTVKSHKNGVAVGVPFADVPREQIMDFKTKALQEIEGRTA